MSTARITKSKVDELVPPVAGQAFLRDTELKGFAVRITSSGARSFVLEKRIGGRLRRFTLAKYPELTVEQARKEAQAQLGKIATGGDPVAEKKARQVPRLTLSQAFLDFKLARRSLSPRTIELYQYVHDSLFKEWQSRSLSELSKDQVMRKHTELAERGTYIANGAMRFLSSLYSFAISHYDNAHGQPLIVRNPVDAITKNRAWFPETRRQTYIAPAQLPAWHRTVDSMRRGTDAYASRIAELLLVLLFTGLRLNEGAALRVRDFDLQARTLHVQKTKNGKPLTIPLPTYLLSLLRSRIEGQPLDAFLFHGIDPAKPTPEPHRFCKGIAKKSGVEFTPHDLRRTFITTAERMDVSMLAIKRLVNHTSGDVTAGYVVMDIERLRVPMERIAVSLLDHIANGDKARVVPFAAKVSA